MCIFDHISLNSAYEGNVPDKICIEDQNTHFVFNNLYFENRVVYEIMRENILEPDRTQMTLRRMRFACWMTKATNTNSK